MGCHGEITKNSWLGFFRGCVVGVLCIVLIVTDGPFWWADDPEPELAIPELFTPPSILIEKAKIQPVQIEEKPATWRKVKDLTAWTIAREESAREDKPILCLITFKGCGPCAKFKKLVKEDPELLEQVAEQYILVGCDYSIWPSLRSAPWIGVLSAEKVEVDFERPPSTASGWRAYVKTLLDR